MYKSIVVECNTKAKKIAEAIEKKSEEMEPDGYLLVSTTMSPSEKLILTFYKKY